MTGFVVQGHNCIFVQRSKASLKFFKCSYEIIILFYIMVTQKKKKKYIYIVYIYIYLNVYIYIYIYIYI